MVLEQHLVVQFPALELYLAIPGLETLFECLSRFLDKEVMLRLLLGLALDADELPFSFSLLL